MIAIQEKILSPQSKHAGIDGTGFESHHISHYFVKRKAKVLDVYQMTTYTRYPKVGIVADSNSHLVLAGIPTRGPGPDITHYETALTAATKNISIALITADAGYDSEHSHVFARARGIRTIIPPLIGRRTDKLPRGYWRKIMATRFNKQLYGQRWQVETVNSMIKRNLGSALRARSYWTQCWEIMLRLLTHNIMIVLPG